MRLFRQQHKQESGFTLVETIIAVAVLLVVSTAVVPRFRMIKKTMDRMNARQSATTLESELRSVLADERNVAYSAERSSNANVKTCVANKGSCTNNATYEMPVYIIGQTQPLSGPNVFYKRDGRRCATAGCGPISVTTRIGTFCSGTATCTPFNSVAIRFTINDTATKTVLANDVVEMVQDMSQLSSTGSFACPTNQVLRGIGLNGGPACMPISSIKYQDAGNRNAGEVKVKRETCFKKKKEQKPKEGGGEGEMEEVEVEDRNDNRYISGIDKNGSLDCKDKTW